jgi:hypothetical protein
MQSKFVIWDRIEDAKIEIILTDTIEIFINGISVWSKVVEDSGDYDLYHELLDDIEKINISYIKKNIEDYQKLSEEFLQKLKTIV